MGTESVTSLQPPAWDVVDWTAHWERLAAERDRLATEKAQFEGEVWVLISKHRDTQNRVTGLEAERAQLNTSIAHLSTEIKTLEREAVILVREAQEARQENNALIDEVLRRQTERDTLQSEAECVRADWDVRSTKLNARNAAAIEREAALDTRQVELDSRLAALESEKRDAGELFDLQSDQLGLRERSLKKAEKKLASDKAHNGCFATFFAPFLIVLGALIGGAVVAGLILL